MRHIRRFAGFSDDKPSTENSKIQPKPQTHDKAFAENEKAKIVE
jgi:hypothetical protein